MKKIKNTNLEVKKKFLPKFVKMMEKQLLSGGKRYALSGNKEFTDLICEAGGEKGVIWVMQTIMKYCGELINCVLYDLPIPAEDFPKIAVYAVIGMIKLEDFLVYKESIGDEV